MTPRPAAETDAPALAALHARAFDRPWPEADFARFLREAGVTGLIVGDAGFILGRLVADEAEILTLAVAPDARRAGIGRALVEAFAQAVGARGALAVFLEVGEDNPAALALYAATGFEGAGRRRAYYARPGGVRADALVLRRALNTRDGGDYLSATSPKQP